MTSLNHQSVQTHVTVIAAIYTVFGAVTLFAAIISGIAISGSGIISRDLEAIGITILVSAFVTMLLGIVSAPFLAVGLGLFKRAPWSRFVGLIAGCISLLAFPLGTILGVYTIWVLTRPETAELLSSANGTSDQPRR